MDAKTIHDSGQIGTAPPPGAPQEVSQPLTPSAGGMAVTARDRQAFEVNPDLRVDDRSPIQKARENERELAPLTFPSGGGSTGGVAEAVEAVAQDRLDPFYDRLKASAKAVASAPDRLLRRGSGRVLEAVTDPAAESAPVEEVTASDDSKGAGPAASDPVDDRPRPPAYSDTDSPSRGVPRGTSTQGKEITGGFGDQGSLQYFALDGTELLVLVKDMAKDLLARCDNDLRFNQAITYPRVHVRVCVEISGFAKDDKDIIDKVQDVAKLPMEVAREIADEIVFVVINEARETDAQGEPMTAPNDLRRSLGIPLPGKHVVAGPGGFDTMADVW